MKVYFHEIKDSELAYAFTEDTPWVMEVIGSLDERMDRIQRPPNWKPRSRKTEVSFTHRRVEDLIHVTGKVKTQLFLLCSLCADAFQFPIQTQFHCLLTQSELYAEAPRETSHQSTTGFEPDDDEDLEDEGPAFDLNASDFEVTVVKEPIANLKEILQEQLILILPMQPKPDKDEKGDCVKCGKPQLSPIKEQAEPLKENPFSVLKDFGQKTAGKKPIS